MDNYIFFIYVEVSKSAKLISINLYDMSEIWPLKQTKKHRNYIIIDGEILWSNQHVKKQIDEWRTSVRGNPF